jgi:hypothetical protein
MAAYREIKRTCEELQRRVDVLEGHPNNEENNYFGTWSF